MTDLTDLSWPPEWRRAPLGGWLMPALVSVLVVILLLAGLIALDQDNQGAAAAIGVVIVVIAPIVVNSRPSRPRPAVETVQVDAGGVRSAGVRFAVRPSSPIVSLSLTVMGVAFLALAVAAMVIAVSRREAQLVVGFVVLAGVGSVLLLGGVVGLFSSRKGTGIDLTPQHVVIALGAGQKVLAWDDIARVGATSIRYGLGAMPRPVQNWLTIATKETADPTGRLQGRSGALGRLAAKASADVVAGVPDDRLLNDPRLVYHGLRYYLEHADARIELADGSAARRLEAGELS